MSDDFMDMLRDLLPGVTDVRLRAVVAVCAREIGRRGGRGNKREVCTGLQTGSETRANPPQSVLDLGSDPDPVRQISKRSGSGDRECDEPAEPTWFGLWWKRYPGRRKFKRAACLAICRTLKPEQIQRMEQVLEHCKRSEDWTKDRGKFIPGPLPWLRGKPWLEDIADLSAPAPRDPYALPRLG